MSHTMIILCWYLPYVNVPTGAVLAKVSGILFYMGVILTLSIPVLKGNCKIAYFTQATMMFHIEILRTFQYYETRYKHYCDWRVPFGYFILFSYWLK